MPPQLLLDEVNEESTTSTSASGPSPKSKGLRQSRGKDSSRSQTGRWTHEEHVIFLQGLELHGKEWKKIAKILPTRSLVQIRSHAQKYFQKVSAAKEIGIGDGVDDLQLLMDGKRMGHGSSIPPSPSGASGKKKKEGSASALTKKLGRTVSCSSLGSTATFQSSSSSLSLSSMVTTATYSNTCVPAQSGTRRRNTPSSSIAERQATITDVKDENLNETDYSSENGSFASFFMDFGSTNNNTSRLPPPPLLTVSCSTSSCGDATTADDFLSLDEYDNLESLDLLSADDLDVFMNDMYPSEDVMMNKQEGGAGGEGGWTDKLPHKPSNVLHEPCQAQQQQGASYIDCSTTTTATTSSHHTFFPSSSAAAVVEGEGQHWLCSAPAETLTHAPMMIPLQSNHETSSSAASCSSVTSSPSLGPEQVYRPQSYYQAEEGGGVDMMMMHMPSSTTVHQYQQTAMVMMQQQYYYHQQQQQH